MTWLKICHAVFLLGFSSLALAGFCNVGKVAAVHGNATVLRDGHLIQVGVDLAVCNGDKYLTDKGSVIQLALIDGSKITIGKGTEFIVKAFEINKDKDQPDLALFELIKGAFRAVTGVLPKKQHRYEVQTSLATIGVRGTDFWGGFGLTENGLDVVMLSGKGVYVVNAQGESVELDVSGLGTTVLGAAAPSEPKKWKDEKVAQALATITP